MIFKENKYYTAHPCPLPINTDTRGWDLYLFESKDKRFCHAIVGVKSKENFTVMIDPDDGDEAVLIAVKKALQKIHGV